VIAALAIVMQLAQGQPAPEQSRAAADAMARAA